MWANNLGYSIKAFNKNLTKDSASLNSLFVSSISTLFFKFVFCVCLFHFKWHIISLIISKLIIPILPPTQGAEYMCGNTTDVGFPNLVIKSLSMYSLTNILTLHNLRSSSLFTRNNQVVFLLEIVLQLIPKFYFEHVLILRSLPYTTSTGKHWRTYSHQCRNSLLWFDYPKYRYSASE